MPIANRIAVICIVAAIGCGKSLQPSNDLSDVVRDPGAGNVATTASSGMGGTTTVQAGRPSAGAAAAVGGTGGVAGALTAQAGSAGGVTMQPPKTDTNVPRGKWETFGGDLSHTRSQLTETTLSAQNVAMLKPAFDIAAPGVTATPAIYGGIIYWADWAGFVHATQLDKTELWKVDRSAMLGGYTGSPHVTGTVVYVANRNGLVSALDRMTGNVVWEVKLDAGPHTHIWSSPVVAEQDGVLVIGIGGAGTRDNGDPLPQSQLESFHGRIEGLDSATGKSLWQVEVSPAPMNGAGVSVWSSAALDTERKLAFIGTGNNYYRPVSALSDSLLAIDYMTGKLVWSKQFTMNDAWTYGTLVSGGVDGDVGATPNLFEVAGKPVVGVGDKPGTYYVLDRMTGDEVWKAKLTDGSGFQGGVMAPAAVADGTVFVVSNNGTRSSTVFALRSEDGMPKWKHDVTDPTFGGPAYANGVLYVGDQAGNIYALDAADGGELWKTAVSQRRGGGFSLVDGMLFTGYGMHFSDSRMEPLTGGLVMYSLNGQGMVTGPAMTSDCVAGTAVTAAPTFSNVYQGVLCADGCAKVCHGSSADAMLDISTRALAYQALVGAARGPACGASGLKLVEPMNPMASVLYLKLAAMPSCGMSMPPGVTAANTPITPAMLSAVRAWIEAGAPNN